MEKELGKFLLDVAKLVIGGVLLAAIMDDVTNRWGIYFFGVLATFVLIFTGLSLINNKEKSNFSSRLRRSGRIHKWNIGI